MSYQQDTEAGTLIENNVEEQPKRSFFRPAMIVLTIVAMAMLGFAVSSSTGFNTMRAPINFKKSADADVDTSVDTRRPTKSPSEVADTKFPTYSPGYISNDDKTYKPTLSPSVYPDEKSFFPTYAPNENTAPPETYHPTVKPSVYDKTHYPSYAPDYVKPTKTYSHQPTISPTLKPTKASKSNKSSKSKSK